MVSYSNRPIHAEEMALQNIKYNKNIQKNKMTKLNMLVIRIDGSSNSNSYRIISSKPCENCINRIKSYNKFGYIIDKIYYSTSENEIKCEKITKIIPTHQSKYYKNLYATKNKKIC